MNRSDYKSIAVPTTTKKSSGGFYLYSTIGFIIVLPILSLWLEHNTNGQPIDPGHIGKWFVFWAVGVRLFTAGMSQIINPAFTAIKVFRFRTKESIVVIRELGFANVAMGVVAILSLFQQSFRPAIAVSGGIFFLFAGLQHIVKKPGSRNEVIAMVTDLIVFAVMFLYVSFTYFS